MLIHIVPKLIEPDFPVTSAIVDISIPECGLLLVGGKDITARRPYPNKRHLVACRKKGNKAIAGILVEVEGHLSLYTAITRWLVNDEIITHVVEHTVLDQELDAVSDDLTLCRPHYGTEWQNRWPACYAKEKAIFRQPTMEVVIVESASTTPKPAHRNDVTYDRGIGWTDSEHFPELESTRGIILRFEPFQLHTIERERLLCDRSHDLFRIPAISDAFHAKPVVLPNLTIPLQNGIMAKLLLAPPPVPDANGNYPLLTGEGVQYPEIFVAFYREPHLFMAVAPWRAVLSGDETFDLTPELNLDTNDLFELDSKGWELMGKFGMYPTVFVMQDS